MGKESLSKYSDFTAWLAKDRPLLIAIFASHSVGIRGTRFTTVPEIVKGQVCINLCLLVDQRRE